MQIYLNVTIFQLVFKINVGDLLCATEWKLCVVMHVRIIPILASISHMNYV